MEHVMPIVYSKGYNTTACGLEKKSPADLLKYRRIWHFLHQKKVLDHERHKFYYPEDLPKRRWINEVMTKRYLLTHNYSIPLSKYL
jgi:hypothetical protein